VTPVEALLAYSVAAALLTLTPGLDTALILRTAAVEGPRRAGMAAVGIVTGCLIWGAAVALGLGALLETSKLAFTILKWAGAAYLVWLGLNLIVKPRKAFVPDGAAAGAEASGWAWLRRGLLTNLLNPKVGVFYVSFLPQFLPDSLHAAMGGIWCAALIAATAPLSKVLRRAAVVTWLDRITGGVFLAFAAKLALEKA